MSICNSFSRPYLTPLSLILGWTLNFSPVAAPVDAAPLSTKTASPKKRLQATDIDGKPHVFSATKNKISALIFISHDCPISNSYAPEIKRIAADYAKRGVDFTLVYAEDGLSAAGARAHARQFGYAMPIILDSSHKLSVAVGATVTPEAVLLSPTGARLYGGRINNRYVTWGKTRANISENDLRDALDAVLAGKPAPHATTRAIGCFIPTSPTAAP